MTCKALTLLVGILLTGPGFARTPPLVLCQHHCHQRYSLHLSTEDWTEVKDLFQPRPANAAEERRCIAKALVIFEQALLADRDQQATEGIDQLYSEKDLERNAAGFIARLQDERLIHWHVLRRTEHRNGYSSAYTVSLQQLDNGELFALDTSVTSLGKAPLVMPMSEWKRDPSDNLWHRIGNIFSSQRDDN